MLEEEGSCSSERELVQCNCGFFSENSVLRGGYSGFLTKRQEGILPCTWRFVQIDAKNKYVCCKDNTNIFLNNYDKFNTIFQKKKQKIEI